MRRHESASETVVRGAAELRVKESDPIATLVRNLERLGAGAMELPTALSSKGVRNRCAASRDARGPPHRNGLRHARRAGGEQDRGGRSECVAVSYPGYWADLTAYCNEPPQRHRHRRARRLGKVFDRAMGAQRIGFKHVDSGALYRAATRPVEGRGRPR